MPKVLVSNNSAILKHLAAKAFRRLGLEIIVASHGDEAFQLAESEQPDLAILDAEMSSISGYEATQKIKVVAPDCRVVLVMGRRISADQMRRVSESGCDEVLIAPMSSDELYDVVAIQLTLPRRGSERYTIDLAVVTSDGQRSIDGRVTNLSIDGARLVLPESLQEDTKLTLTITPDDTEDEPVQIEAKVVWAQNQQAETVIGAAFETVDDQARARLSRLTQWDIIEDHEFPRVVLKGDITEATSFRDLLPVMVGRVDFDVSQVTYINSLGVREWVEFLQKAPIQGYEFHACSIPFVIQASLVEDFVGRGTITSFFAPYHCEECDMQEERLLQSATILASESLSPPMFTCPSCEGELEFDDIPRRYFAFLAPVGD